MTDLSGARVAIANRGEIAVRIAATCTRLGAIPVLLLGDPDLGGYAARQVGRVERVGPAGSELNVELVIAAATRGHADYLHPGYGFLSERPALASACQAAGIRFVGPSAATLALCGDKVATRNLAERAGVPVVAASEPLDEEPEHWLAAGEAVGYPLMVKPAEAGGGRGLRDVADASALVAAVRASRREGAASGADGAIFLERAFTEPRHVEVQVVADAARTFALGDRDCSLQRRHQKVIEEAPAPNIPPETRQRLHDYACRVARAAELRGIATCEFLLGQDGTVSFLEVNPRIQVEHPVTELVTGVDLIAWQLFIAAGDVIPEAGTPPPRGHAIEARVYAEDPSIEFMPVAGQLVTVAWPCGPAIRVDAGYASGDAVPNAYDAMLAKVIAHGRDRDVALAALRDALTDTVIAGVATNTAWLLDLLDDEAVAAGHATTGTARAVRAFDPPRGLAPVAAVASSVDRAIGPATDPWTAIGPMRGSGRATVVVHGDDWEERLAVWRDGARWQAARDGDVAPICWWRGPDGVWTIAAGDDVSKYAVMERDGRLDVYGARGRWNVQMGPKPVRRALGAMRRGDGLIRAPLPASVVGVHVAIGDHVGRGDPLVTLSAMKMELVCDAPSDAVVTALACAEGDLVAADQVLVKLDPILEDGGDA